jgi:hypothetical protein
MACGGASGSACGALCAAIRSTPEALIRYPDTGADRGARADTATGYRFLCGGLGRRRRPTIVEAPAWMTRGRFTGT